MTVTADGDGPELGERSPEVDLLSGRPDDKRNVAMVSFLLPHLERWSFQDVSIHHRDRADEAASDGEVCQVVCCPGRVLLPRDGLGRKQERVQGHVWRAGVNMGLKVLREEHKADIQSALK